MLKLNTRVQTINWEHEKPLVAYTDVTTDAVGSIEADYVIVTVPLGVLKRDSATMFVPALPPRKIEAIQSLSFGVVNKIFLTFDSVWWPDNFSLYLLWLESDIAKLSVR